MYFAITFFIITISIYPQENSRLMSNKSFVPEWAKKVIWYQIFPERFRNGDVSNDPTLESIKGSYPHDYISPWQVHPWTSDWYELQPYEKLNGKNFWFNVQRRRYGGDLQGIIDKLDYLKELGVSALYLNPVFEAPSHHKYDGATYHHVDPYLGPDPEGDKKLIDQEIPHDPSTWVWTSADKLLLKLIQEVHNRGMYIILDGVFNHMGVNSWAFQDVVNNQENSLYKDWFKIKSWNDSIKGTKFDYEGWWGVKELPELNQDENGITEEPKKYIWDITKRWMDPNGDGNTSDGIDGWRLDVAFCIKHQFWKDWRKHVKSINPNAYLTAEVIDSIKHLKPYLMGDEFDAVMNYNFAFYSAGYFIEQKNKLTGHKFDQKLEDLRKAFHPDVAYVQQNLFGSHDANRIGSHIVNKNLGNYGDWGKYFGLSKAENKDYNVRKPNEEEISIQKLFVIFQFTYVGAPMIYYGDEVGMWGANDPDCRKPMIWDDLKYDDEKFLPNQTLREPDKVEVNNSLLEHYKKMISIRNNNETLQIGNYRTIYKNDYNTFCFERFTDSQSIVVVLNNSDADNNINIKGVKSGEYFDLLHDTIVEVKSGVLKIKLPKKWGAVLLRKN